MIRQARQACPELRPLQLLLAERSGEIALELPLAIERGAAARETISSLDEGFLRLVLSSLRLPVAAGGLLASLLGLADRRAESGGVCSGRGFGKVVELGQQGRRRRSQVAALGVEGGAFLVQRGDLSGQSGVLGPSLENGAPTRLEVAARRFARALSNALCLPSRIRGEFRCRQCALRVQQALPGRCALSPQLKQAGALLETCRGGATGVGPAHEAVPAPQAAIGTYQPLALAQLPLQPIGRFGIDHTHLGQPTS